MKKPSFVSLCAEATTTSTTTVGIRPAVAALFSELTDPSSLAQTGRRFICKSCYFLGTTAEEMAQHVELVHQPQDPVPCPYCKSYYKSTGSLQNHISLKHRELHAKMKQLPLL